jgi:hypothetical protein
MGTPLHQGAFVCPRGVLDGLCHVLSIGKLAAGQARYYLDQTGGRIDRASSVASGVEDYYVGGAEAPGVCWCP